VAKRPGDPVQLAKQVFDIAVGEAEDTVGESKSSKSQGTSGSLRAANRELPS